jgi:glycosyltransferase involved in cell wall biosynthesis
MRIAYLVNRYPRTSHSFIRREIEAVEAHGVEVMRLSQRPLDEALATEADVAELRRTRIILAEGVLGHAIALLHALRRPVSLARTLALAVRLGWRSERGLLRHLVYAAEACVLVRWLREAEVEHLHAHFGTNSATVAMLCRELGGPPFSFTVHGPDEFDKPEFLGIPEKIRRAAFVVAISSYGRAQLWRWARHDDWDKIHVVRCGLEGNLLNTPQTPVPMEPRLVCVARLGAQKGHLLLIEAAARLVEEGTELELVLVGDGPLRAEVEALVRRRGLEGRVRIAGWMGAAAVREQVIRSRALVLPSFAEGLPVVIMEALALGRPVVTTAIAGTPELVQPGLTGWLVPAGEVDPLVDAMRSALRESPARLAEMGRTGAPRCVRRGSQAPRSRGARPPAERRRVTSAPLPGGERPSRRSLFTPL